jgi:hypothetical protein
VNVPRSLDFAPPDTVTVPVAVTGGHAPAHAPEHADLPPVSFSHMYTARPEPSVRNVPADDEAVLMTVAPDPPALLLAAALLALLLAGTAAADELLGAAAAELLLLLLLLPLAHADTSSATPTAPPTPVASLAGAGIRLRMEFFIAFVSCLGRTVRTSSAARVTVDRGTGEVRRGIGSGGKRDVIQSIYLR